MASHSNRVVHHGGGSDSVYGLGMIGAWVFYIGRATTPRERVLGFLKGMVWPAMFVYEMLKFLDEGSPVTQHLPPAPTAPTSYQAETKVSGPSVTTRGRSARKPAHGGKSKAKKSTRK